MCIRDRLQRWSRELASWSFAGAGGGGFMLLVARDASRAEAIRASIERDRPHPRARAFDFEVDPAGLKGEHAPAQGDRQHGVQGMREGAGESCQ